MYKCKYMYMYMYIHVLQITPKGGALDTSKSSWITRYQPGVLLLKGSMRECLIQRMLHEREDEFCEYANLR